MKALLVGIQTPEVSDLDQEGSLVELSRLVTTLGYQVVGKVSQRRQTTRAASVLGEGKLRELARWTGGPGQIAPTVVHKKNKAQVKFDESPLDEEEEVFEAETEEPQDEDQSEAPRETAEVAIFDCDLSPSQLRNLESALGVTVLDRTGVIIEIFSRHARTKAARAQVEIARLRYLAPRIRETGGGEDRQGGGIGAKGAGETTLERDKRKIRDRLKELRDELESIGDEHLTRQARRAQENCVALVGYTNAGKSSLMRAMTGSEVLVADKLFATLDTTVRPIYPETTPKILLSDTVGFIKKLPHDLVASFRSTLDEALNASLLLFVVDCADPAFRSQLEVTIQVLTEVGAGDTPRLLILNKRDRLTPEQETELRREFPEAIFLSTRNPEDLKSLRSQLESFFEKGMNEEDVFVSYTMKGIIGAIRSRMKVVSESYDENGVVLRVRGYPDDIARVRQQIAASDAKHT